MNPEKLQRKQNPNHRGPIKRLVKRMMTLMKKMRPEKRKLKKHHRKAGRAQVKRKVIRMKKTMRLLKQVPKRKVHEQ